MYQMHPTIAGVSELSINFKQDQSWIFIKKLQQFRISYKLQSDPSLELINNAQNISLIKKSKTFRN